MILELYHYRRYVLTNALRDVRHRYTGTGLGVFWNVILPLSQIAIFTFVFARIMPVRLRENASPLLFLVYLCSGLLPWTAFTETVQRGTNSFLENATYLKKLKIPEHVFVAQSVLAATFNLAISLALLVILAVCCGLRPDVRWLLLPVICALWQAAGFGLGLGLGTINVFLRDIGQLVPVLFQLWMWSVPVVYGDQILPNWYRALIPWNPPGPFLAGIRMILIDNQAPTATLWLAMAGWTVFFLVAGGVVLHLLRREIRDVL